MNKNTKKWLLIGGIAFLFAINIGALITLIYQNNRYRQLLPFERYERMHSRHDMHSGMRGRMHDSMRSGENKRKYLSDQFVKQRLNLSEKQYNEFKKLRTESRKQHRQIINKIQEKRSALLNEMAKENSDTTRLNKLTEEFGSLHKSLKKETIQHFIKLKQICNNDQQEALFDMIRHMERMHAGHHIMGGRHHK